MKTGSMRRCLLVAGGLNAEFNHSRYAHELSWWAERRPHRTRVFVPAVLGRWHRFRTPAGFGKAEMPSLAHKNTLGRTAATD